MVTTGTPAEERERRHWLSIALVVAVAYPLIGVVFALFDSSAGPAPIRFWRVAAWVACAVFFVGHLVFEHRRAGSSPKGAAGRASLAVALGAFVLAIWVLVHSRWVGNTSQSPLAPLALVLFPLVTGAPAFLAGLFLLTFANRLRRTVAPPR